MLRLRFREIKPRDIMNHFCLQLDLSSCRTRHGDILRARDRLQPPERRARGDKTLSTCHRKGKGGELVYVQFYKITYLISVLGAVHFAASPLEAKAPRRASPLEAKAPRRASPLEAKALRAPLRGETFNVLLGIHEYEPHYSLTRPTLLGCWWKGVWWRRWRWSGRRRRWWWRGQRWRRGWRQRRRWRRGWRRRRRQRKRRRRGRWRGPRL